MNEHEHASQLSALFDDELPADQAELVIRRALKDPALRASWSRYSLIGAAMRSQPLAIRHSLADDLASRVQARVHAEPENEAAVSPQSLSAAGASRVAGLRRGAWGVAIAAGVAAVSLLLVRMQLPQATATVAVVESASRPAPVTLGALSANVAVPKPVLEARIASANNALPSYTTPVNNSDSGQRLSAPLVNYVVAHSAVTTSAVRLSPLSSVMSGNYDLSQGTVEMTEAEIGARR
jgi:sigma-E factor negative regulatory protein RseA